MDEHHHGRRDFLKQMTALGMAGGPVVGGWRPSVARAGEAQGRRGMKTSYDPAAKFELKVTEMEFRRTAAGRQLMARIYQPQGVGPFPTVLDLHGGVAPQGPSRRGADGPRHRVQRRPGGGHRPEALGGSAVPGVGAGRELRRALAQIQVFIARQLKA